MKKLLITILCLSPLACFADTGATDIEDTISFAPIALFLLIMIFTVLKLRKDGTKLSDLMTEKDQPVPPQAEGSATSQPSQSISRFIAFVTGLVALSIGVTLTTFFMYCHFIDPAKPVDLSNLTTVIWGMGIGIIPYGFNKASAALKN